MGHSATHAELHRLFTERRYDDIDAHLAPEFMFEDLARHITLKTHGEFLDYLRDWAAMSSDVVPTDATYFEGPDHSVALFHARGTNDGVMGDLPATGRAMDLPVCEVIHYTADGKVLADELYWDQMTMMGQLGLLPEEGEGGEAAGGAMTGPAETVRGFLEAFDRMDFDALRDTMTEDSQGVDEISRAWMRGGDAIRGYFDAISGVVSDIHSELSDVEERIYGDTAVVTCWIEQDYTMQGEPQHISSPVTTVLRQEDGRWKAVLMHAVPMPPE